MSDWSDKFSACLLGLAIGDAIGLPREGLSPRRAQRMFGNTPLRHQFLLHRGMTSDDTEHACMTAQALLASAGDPQIFARSLAWRLRGWLLSIPAGIGLATLRSILKLWCGFPPNKSGIYSAGRPRHACPHPRPLDRRHKRRSRHRQNSRQRLHTPHPHRSPRRPRLPHHRPRHRPCRPPRPDSFHRRELLSKLTPHITDPELRSHLTQIQQHLDRHATPAEFAQSLNLHNGITGYINHTVPIALYCCLHSPNDFRQAVESVILLGGDTDTTAAIVAAISGSCLGQQAIPQDWLHGILEYPRSANWIRSLASRLAQEAQLPPQERSHHPLPLAWPALAIRNPLFILIVLLHGFRRLLPPY